MNKKGISAVIGVILMLALTVAVALTVYVYVNDMLDTPKINAGFITDKIVCIHNFGEEIFKFELDNTTVIIVDEITYHNYEIGEYYDPSN